LGGTSIYGSSPSNPGLAATGLQNGQDVSALTGLFNTFGISSTSSVGSYSLSVGGALTNPNYTVTSTVNGQWVVTPVFLPIFSSAILPDAWLIHSAFLSWEGFVGAYDPESADFVSGAPTVFMEDARWR
jgi:hypothetical protein